MSYLLHHLNIVYTEIVYMNIVTFLLELYLNCK
jgi:hypothetical protein